MMSSALEYEDPRASRITVIKGASSTDIVVPPRRSVFAILFLCFWLVGWAVGLFNVAPTLLEPGSADRSAQLFTLAWLIMWLLGGFSAIGGVLWMVFGKEKITVTQLALTHNHELFIRFRERKYRSGDIENLRWIESHPSENNALAHFRGTTRVEFDYGPKSVKVAFGTDAGEGRAIIDAVKARISRGRNQ